MRLFWPTSSLPPHSHRSLSFCIDFCPERHHALLHSSSSYTAGTSGYLCVEHRVAPTPPRTAFAAAEACCCCNTPLPNTALKSTVHGEQVTPLVQVKTSNFTLHSIGVWPRFPSRLQYPTNSGPFDSTLAYLLLAWVAVSSVDNAPKDIARSQGTALQTT